MGLNHFFLLWASLPFALALIFSCSSDNDNGKDGSTKSGLYTGCKSQGICAPVPSVGSDEYCQAMNGVIDNSCTFVNCKKAGACSPALSAEDCQTIGGDVVSDSECGNNSPGASVNCKIAGVCTSAPSAEACQTAGGTVVPDSECGNNPSDDIGFCLYMYAANCTPGVRRSTCLAAGGTFNKNSCPTGFDNGSGQYCYYEGGCLLIGTNSLCLVSNANECTNYNGVIHTYEWCLDNVEPSDIVGCD